jgi:serine phosphatase RsbU (regulator of sigma subunit)
LIGFADKLALTVSVALENARLYTAEHNISETLQSAIFSKPQKLPGIEMGYQYRSATELAKIGGDFFDLLDLGNNMVGLIIGDVSGKGLDAAAITYIVKSTLRAYAYLDSNPASVLARTNEAVKRQIKDGQFITAIYATIDISTGVVEFASAGHPDPFLCTSGNCEMIAACRNLPLGILSGMEFESSKIMLKQEDKLILYTDGLIEAKRNGELFTDARVKDVLMNNCFDCEPADIALQLLKAAENFSGNNLSDDVAIVVVKYPAQSNVTDYGKTVKENGCAIAGEVDAYHNNESGCHTAA